MTRKSLAQSFAEEFLVKGPLSVGIEQKAIRRRRDGVEYVTLPEIKDAFRQWIQTHCTTAEDEEEVKRINIHFPSKEFATYLKKKKAGGHWHYVREAPSHHRSKSESGSDDEDSGTKRPRATSPDRKSQPMGYPLLPPLRVPLYPIPTLAQGICMSPPTAGGGLPTATPVTITPSTFFRFPMGSMRPQFVAFAGMLAPSATSPPPPLATTINPATNPALPELSSVASLAAMLSSHGQGQGQGPLPTLPTAPLTGDSMGLFMNGLSAMLNLANICQRSPATATALNAFMKLVFPASPPLPIPAAPTPPPAAPSGCDLKNDAPAAPAIPTDPALPALNLPSPQPPQQPTTPPVTPSSPETPTSPAAAPSPAPVPALPRASPLEA
ncbi:hypothetical protein PAPYR_5766 [Paratrimastix pyriformis]|uniref:Uncharacterized protein n=1 Tax=Paratrimastix pyriformis TaxID=342808 RepID=A0ABQ8UPB2_9EUKA|nr:hypothetical protein PAPYR_5766 [Paratrimastix pyriformis]